MSLSYRKVSCHTPVSGDVLPIGSSTAEDFCSSVIVTAGSLVASVIKALLAWLLSLANTWWFQTSSISVIEFTVRLGTLRALEVGWMYASKF